MDIAVYIKVLISFLLVLLTFGKWKEYVVLNKLSCFFADNCTVIRKNYIKMYTNGGANYCTARGRNVIITASEPNHNADTDDAVP